MLVSWSEAGNAVEREVEVERDVLIFLNGRVKAFAPCFTWFFKDAPLPERTEDLVEEAALVVDLGM
jgi:hypothetical protein